MKYFILTTVIVHAFGVAQGQMIKDPVADFLTLPIEDRYTDASEVVEIQKVSVDLDLDGRPELLVGHHKMWWGDNDGIYFAIYKKLPSGGYKRLTKPTEDVGLNFRDGRPEYNFVGRVDELGDTGLLICNPYQGDGELITQKLESMVFVSIAGDIVRVRELPGLDLSKDSDLAFYRKYFPLPSKQGDYRSESLKSDALKALGLVLPDWTKPIRLEDSEIESNQSEVIIDVPQLVDTTGHKKSPETKSTKVKPSEKSSSLKPWSIIVALIAVLFGLAWLLLKKRK